MADLRCQRQKQQQQQQHQELNAAGDSVAIKPISTIDSVDIDRISSGGKRDLPGGKRDLPPEFQLPPPRIPVALHRSSPQVPRAQSVSPLRSPPPCPNIEDVPPPPLHPRLAGVDQGLRVSSSRISSGNNSPITVSINARRHRQSNPEGLGRPVLPATDASTRSGRSASPERGNGSKERHGEIGEGVGVNSISRSADRELLSGRGDRGQGLTECGVSGLQSKALQPNTERHLPHQQQKQLPPRLQYNGRRDKVDRIICRDSDPLERHSLLHEDTNGVKCNDVNLNDIRDDDFSNSTVLGPTDTNFVQRINDNFVRLNQDTNQRNVVALDRWPLNSLASSQQQQQSDALLLERVSKNRKPTCNEYVDEPSKAKQNLAHGGVNGKQSSGSLSITQSSGNNPAVGLSSVRPAPRQVSLRDCDEVVVSQPATSMTISKSSKPLTSSEKSVSKSSGCKEGLICPQCGLCRCAICTGRPRRGSEGVVRGDGRVKDCDGDDGEDMESVKDELPSCWLAGGRYECSLQSCMDRVSCVCCLRTCFYHCLYDEDDDVDIVAEPFSCTEAPHCCARWSIIAAFLPLLPCITLYALSEPFRLALQGCLGCRESCRRRRGCRCPTSIPEGEVVTEAPSSSSATATASSSSGTNRSLLIDSAENSSD